VPNALAVKPSALFILLISVVSSALAQSYTIETVPNTRLINNSYVSNPDNLLSDQAVVEINLLLDSLEKKTSAQVAVVMLNSIGDADIFDFAQSLFVKWGIGKSGNDNGLLILFVQDKKTVRFHTGYGLEGDLPDAICKRIQTQKMVPRFKEGDIDGGMIAGAEEIVNILTNDNSKEELISSDNEYKVSDLGGISFMAAIAWLVGGPFYFFRKRKAGFANSRNFQHDGPHTTITKGNWWLWYYFLPVILLVAITYVESRAIFFGGLYSFIVVLAIGKYNRMNRSADVWIKKGEHHAVYEFYQKNKGVMALPFLFPIPFAFLMGHFKKRKLAARNNPRPCKKCNQLIHAPMSEATEDEFLSTETIFEETLKSVDYDVWRCNLCGDFHYEMYINPKTRFTQCPKCSTYALYAAGSSTKVAATTSSSGIMEVVKQCKYCNKKTIVEEDIPMISTSTDSSSSSSSDSGGSWGGGDSGGGGASSSW
jgi:uncharacterized protein